MLFSRRVFVGVCGAGPSGPLGRLGAGGDEAGELQLLLDGAHEPLLDLGDPDLGDDLVEEAQDHQAPGLDLGDAAGAQVEQLLVVEAPGGAGVPGALDIAVLDLEVGDGVGLGALGQDEVAVELVGVGAAGGVADEAVAHPHGVGALALERPLVGHARVAVRLGVGHVGAVLLVLAGVGEVDAEGLDAPALAGEAQVGADAHMQTRRSKPLPGPRMFLLHLLLNFLPLCFLLLYPLPNALLCR